MKLTLLDRLIILNQVLQTFGTRESVVLNMAIDRKIGLSADERESVEIISRANSQIELRYKRVADIERTAEFDFSDAELLYMKRRVEEIDRHGMFSADTIGTFDAILDAAKDIAQPPVEAPV